MTRSSRTAVRASEQALPSPLAGAGGTGGRVYPRSPGLQLIDADPVSLGQSRYRACGAED
jgi:hypothetical protein